MEDEAKRKADKAEKKEAREQRLQTASGEAKKLKAAYKKLEGTEAFADLLAKISSFGDYHIKIAKDGVGYRDEVKPDGTKEQVLVQFTNEQKIDHLQRAAGIEEISDYITRQLSNQGS